MLHFGSSAFMVLTQAGKHSPKVPLYTFFVYHQFTAFAVSVFICVSGITLCLSNANKPFNYFKFIFHRMNILVPYFVWSIIYLGISGLIVEKNDAVVWLISGKQLILSLLSGKTYYHLYYIPLIFSLYLLFPLFKKLASICRSPLWLIIFLGIHEGIQYAAVTYMPHYILTYFQLFYFLFMFAIGCWIGEHYDSVKMLISKYGNLVIIPFLCVLAYKIIAFNAAISKISFTDYPQTVTLDNRIYSLCVVFLIIYITPLLAKNKYIDLILDRIGKNSFGIYLIHPLFIYWLQDIFKTSGLWNSYNSSMFKGAIVFMLLVIILAISYAVTEFINYMPLGWLFIGRNDKSTGKVKLPKLSDIISVETHDD